MSGKTEGDDGLSHRDRFCLVMVFAGFACALAAPSGAATGGKPGAGATAVDPGSLAVLRSEMSYCQVAAIDDHSRPLSENEWAFVAGKHLIHFECQGMSGRDAGVMRGYRNVHLTPLAVTRTWRFERKLIFGPQPGRRYLARDFVDAGDQEFVWIEDEETKELVAGVRPEVFEGPDRYSDEEIAEAIASLGTGSTLVVSYRAPKKPVKRFEVRIKNKVVVETSGKEDCRIEIPIAPGYYVVKIAVENDEEHADYSQHLDLDLEPGETRTLTVKGKAWGRSSASIK